jgi:hypothetical protein
MLIIDPDFQSRFQQIAVLDTERGEHPEPRLERADEESGRFCAGVAWRSLSTAPLMATAPPTSSATASRKLKVSSRDGKTISLLSCFPRDLPARMVVFYENGKPSQLPNSRSPG